MQSTMKGKTMSIKQEIKKRQFFFPNYTTRFQSFDPKEPHHSSLYYFLTTIALLYNSTIFGVIWVRKRVKHTVFVKMFDRKKGRTS